jgi:hypothetical protein
VLLCAYIHTGEFLDALVECASATQSTLPAIGGISSGGLDALKQLGQLDFSDLTALRGQFQVLQLVKCGVLLHFYFCTVAAMSSCCLLLRCGDYLHKCA